SSRPDQGVLSVLSGSTSGGVLARRLLPAAIFAPLALGLLVLQIHRAGLSAPMAVSFFAVSSVAVFASLIWVTATRLNRIDRVRKRDEIRQGAQYAVTRVLADAPTLAEATPRILQALLQSLGWGVGTIWSVDPDAGLLRCVDLYHAPGVDASAFAAATRKSAFPPGVGLPGRVWAAGRPHWIEDVTTDSNFPRTPYALQSGL